MRKWGGPFSYSLDIPERKRRTKEKEENDKGKRKEKVPYGRGPGPSPSSTSSFSPSTSTPSAIGGGGSSLSAPPSCREGRTAPHLVRSPQPSWPARLRPRFHRLKVAGHRAVRSILRFSSRVQISIIGTANFCPAPVLSELGCRRVSRDGVSLTRLSFIVEGFHHLVEGRQLGVEDPLILSQVESPPSPPSGNSFGHSY